MTTSFDHRLRGTDESAWLDGRLDALPGLAVPGVGTHLLVVAAHPDDESLGAGGLIAAAVENGATVSVLVVSDGEASHPSSSTHSAAQLAQLRRAEVGDAIKRLGRDIPVRFAAIPDGQLADNLQQLADVINAALATCTHVVTPWIGDRHPDHEACARVTADLVAGTDVEHWQYPIWAWHWADPDAGELSQLSRIDLSPSARAAKDAALRCHRSQHTPLSAAAADQAVLPPNVLAHFQRDFECFVVSQAGATAPAVSAASADYFDRLYDASNDPWRLATSFYERRKRSLLLASLPRERFVRAFEPGCALGLLTDELADRCAELIAWDGAPAAIAQSTSRLSRHENVHLEQRRIPHEWPDGAIDLIVLSEVGYYCDDLRLLADLCNRSLTDDGVLAVCHWTHPAPDHPHTARAVHDAMGAGAGLHRVVRHVESDFLLDVWSRDARSVAVLDGVLT